MSEDLVLKCLICFVLGYLVARMMRGDGLTDDGDICYCPKTCAEELCTGPEYEAAIKAGYSKNVLHNNCPFGIKAFC